MYRVRQEVTTAFVYWAADSTAASSLYSGQRALGDEDIEHALFVRLGGIDLALVARALDDVVLRKAIELLLADCGPGG